MVLSAEIVSARRATGTKDLKPYSRTEFVVQRLLLLSLALAMTVSNAAAHAEVTRHKAHAAERHSPHASQKRHPHEAAKHAKPKKPPKHAEAVRHKPHKVPKH